MSDKISDLTKARIEKVVLDSLLDKFDNLAELFADKQVFDSFVDLILRGPDVHAEETWIYEVILDLENSQMDNKETRKRFLADVDKKQEKIRQYLEEKGREFGKLHLSLSELITEVSREIHRPTRESDVEFDPNDERGEGFATVTEFKPRNK